MTCEIHFDESIHLGMVIPTWNSPTQQNVDQSDQYIFKFERNENSHTVVSTLILHYQGNLNQLFLKF